MSKRREVEGGNEKEEERRRSEREEGWGEREDREVQLDGSHLFCMQVG